MNFENQILNLTETEFDLNNHSVSDSKSSLISSKTKMIKLLVLLFVLPASILFAQKPEIKTDLIYKVNLPAKKSDKTPVMIMLHGYGSNEADLFDISKSLDERFITFSLRGPFAIPVEGYSWFSLDFLPQKQFKYNYKELKESKSKIFSFISNACKAYKLDSTQIFIMGYSQGAIMSYDLAFSKPEKIKGVIALSGYILPESKQLKTDAGKLMNVNFFIGHGDMDQVVDYKAAEEANKYLTEKKLKVEFKTYQMPHAINGKELNDIKAWLKKNLKEEKK